ncbi:MAG: prepilin-type N-terminal cleavage/methylation domain-containing protein [Nitrospirae bacterium]|nr:prepilin-type N-terminal cleavage/methylation domain-containing protein [Nitrospirota bacterium]
MKKNEGRRQKAEGSAGFTLLELMIALTILTMVIMIIGNGFRLGMNAWEKGENETLWTQRFRVLSGLLSQQIKSAYPYKMELDEEKVVVFEGKADSIMFVTELTGSSYGGFKWVRYSHKDKTLLFKEGLLPDKELTGKISGNEEIVDTDIEEIKFAFYSSEEGEWKDSWEYGKKLPGAVRVKISYFEPFLINIPMGLAKEEEMSAI